MKMVVLKTPFDKKFFLVRGSESDMSIIGGIELSGGLYEPHVMNLLHSIIKPDSVCMDIGANIGTISMVMSHLAPSGKVYSFEPSPVNFMYLEQNLLFNACHNVEALHLGAYDVNKEMQFYDIEAGGGWSFVSNGTQQGTPNQKVTCIKIDDWVKQRKLSSLDLIKMDVEGAEIHALRGARNTIKSFKPDLVIEFNPATVKVYFGENPFYLYKLLTSLYPYIYYIGFDSKLVAVTCYSQLLALIKPTVLGDLLCTYTPR
ncbi:FkbM family methyltransferase [Paenibacillus senegalensis]|uniref:FkbM family methyltransferase n=1 Tax=Paenibacillus senegalensis TaxID=1465766 RepID=UPI00028A28C3|nr:FkbM family methyltransferase [Paenibacillus senegalensis]